MGRLTEFTCDGCDKVEKIKADAPGDWSSVTVELSGFDGYPCGAYGNGARTFDLCATCQKRLVDVASPHNWPRAAKAKAV